MMKNKVTPSILIIVLLVTTAIVAYVLGNGPQIPEGYSQVKEYIHPEPNSTTCLALTPACGYCPGEVIEKACYVKESEQVQSAGR